MSRGTCGMAIRRSIFLFLLVLLVPVMTACAQRDDNTILINTVHFPIPVWWNRAEVSIPDSVYSVPDIEVFAEAISAADTGITRKHRIIKTWVLALRKLNVFPIPLAQQYSSLGMSREAAEVYTLLQEKARTQKGKELEYECSMAYFAGKEYEAAGDKDSALKWYRKAIHLKYHKAGGETAHYYSLAQCAYRCLMNIACDK